MGPRYCSLGCLQALAQRWVSVKQASNKYLSKVVDKLGSFNFPPYSYTPRGFSKVLLFKERGEDISLSPQESIPVMIQTLLVVAASTLLSRKLELGEGVAIYNPQRVLRQLEYDQGTVRISEEFATSGALIIEKNWLLRVAIKSWRA